MTRAPRAWVLNLDAEHELESGSRFTPSRHLERLVARESRRLLGNLVLPGDVVVSARSLALGGPEAARARGLPGLAWSPTARARRLLEAAGARVLDAPPPAVLARVNARAFAVEVRRPHASGSFVKELGPDLERVLELVGRPAPDGWLVRRSFGAAGRGRRRLAAGRPGQADRAWLAAGLRHGALVVEPWVRITREYTRSAWVRRDGSIVLAPPCRQATTAQGAWTATEALRSSELDRADDERLAAMVEDAGRALARAGYFGPFGIDAYRHRRPGSSGADVLNPLSEINARFTMDWTVGMHTRPERDDESFAP